MRFGDEENPTLEQFLYGETNNRRVMALLDNTTNAMLRARKDYVTNMEQVIRGLEDIIKKLERNKNRIAKSNNGWGVSAEIVNNRQLISRLEQRIEAVKSLKLLK